MAQRYYTLATRSANSVWSPQFGAYTRAEVEAERREAYGRAQGYARDDVKIIAHGLGNQAQIDAVNALNGAQCHAPSFCYCYGCI